MGLLALKAAIDKAAEAAGGFPDQEQVIAALAYLEWDSPSGPLKMALANGHQAIQDNAVGLTKYDAESKRVRVTDIAHYPADCVNPPPDINGIAWIEAGFPGSSCD